MKQIYAIITAVAFAATATAQQITPCALSTTALGGVYPAFFSTPSHDVMWTGFQTLGGGNSLSFARTLDAGQSFTMGAIPETTDRGFSSIYALDAQMAYAGLTDANSADGGAVWKTTDGGANWTQKTSTEFTNGYLNSVGFFSADSGVVMGDPNGGYFEVYTTANGGNTWTRVPQGNIPANQPGETGLQGAHAVRGNKVWFSTSGGRVYYSNDKGYTWSVSTVTPSSNLLNVDMADEMNGVAWKLYSNTMYITSNGGQSWTAKPTNPSKMIDQVSAVKNAPGVYVFKELFSGIFVTTNNFDSYSLLGNQYPVNGNQLKMYDASIGWTQSGIVGTDSAVLKISNVPITGVQSTGNTIRKTGLYPNPATADATMVSFELDRNVEVSLTLFDVTGRNVSQQKVRGHEGSNAAVVDCANLPSGIYVLHIKADEDAITMKLTIQ